MIVGSTDRISTRGPPALASNDDSVTATKASKGELRRHIYLINALSRLEQHPFLTGVQVEGERYFRAPRNAVPNSNCSVLESRVVERKATVQSPANAAIAVDYRANFGRPRLHDNPQQWLRLPDSELL